MNCIEIVSIVNFNLFRVLFKTLCKRKKNKIAKYWSSLNCGESKLRSLLVLYLYSRSHCKKKVKVSPYHFVYLFVRTPHLVLVKDSCLWKSEMIAAVVNAFLLPSFL